MSLLVPGAVLVVQHYKSQPEFIDAGSSSGTNLGAFLYMGVAVAAAAAAAAAKAEVAAAVTAVVGVRRGARYEFQFQTFQMGGWGG